MMPVDAIRRSYQFATVTEQVARFSEQLIEMQTRGYVLVASEEDGYVCRTVWRPQKPVLLEELANFSEGRVGWDHDRVMDLQSALWRVLKLDKFHEIAAYVAMMRIASASQLPDTLYDAWNNTRDNGDLYHTAANELVHAGVVRPRAAGMIEPIPAHAVEWVARVQLEFT